MTMRLQSIFDAHVVTAANIAAGRVYKAWQPGRATVYVGDGTNCVAPTPKLWKIQDAELSLVHVTTGMPYMGHYMEIIAPGPQGGGKYILAGEWQSWGNPARLSYPRMVRDGVGWAMFCSRLAAGDVIYFRSTYEEVQP